MDVRGAAWRWAVTVAAVATLTTGCKSGDVIHVPTAHPSLPATSPTPACTGSDGEAVFRGLLADLNGGRQDILDKYITPATRFVRWIDPDADEVLTEVPDPVDGHPALNGLRDHLNALAAGGFQVTVTSFVDDGYSDNTPAEEGGAFDADLHGRGSAKEPVADGHAYGVIDCQTGLLRLVMIDAW